MIRLVILKLCCVYVLKPLQVALKICFDCCSLFVTNANIHSVASLLCTPTVAKTNEVHTIVNSLC